MKKLALKCPKCRGRLVKDGSQRGIQRYLCTACGMRPQNVIGGEAAKAAGIDRKAADALHRKVRKASGVQIYVVTAAQNATPVNAAFLSSLQTYCSARKAQLIVIPYRYKNPTSMWSAAAEHDDWWAPELALYILDRRIVLNQNLILLGDIKTQPTASAPLQGFEGISADKSAIIGHPKLELVTVATPQSRLPKILTTTGAITAKNYLPSKAGKKADFHHTFAACVVEIVGKKFHMRQLVASSDGGFIDIDRKYAGARITKAKCAALVMGDTHQEFIDPDVSRATFDGPNSILHTLRPKYLVWHDVHDFYSRNHHHRGEVFINFVKHHAGKDNVANALQGTCDFIDRVTPSWVTNVFVPSNHPDALARWVKETDPRTDPENAVFWARTFEAMLRGSVWTETGASTIDPFAMWCKRMMKTADQAIFLERDASFIVLDVDLGQHGDAGTNGARASLASFSKLGVKTITGHGHSPGIKDGAGRVGTSSYRRLGYNRGASSWMHTHEALYENGKRSLINIVDGEWRVAT